MSDATRRFALTLTQTCQVMREEKSPDADLEIVYGEPDVVALELPCLMGPIQAGDEISALGPIPMYRARLFAEIDADIEEGDIIIADSKRWKVTEPPQRVPFRGLMHHLEVIMQQEVVQDGV